MKLLVIDFETKDPYISRKMGSGWVYSISNPESDFKILGASIVWEHLDDFSPVYITDHVKIRTMAENADGYIMHNASYDLGCLMALGVDVKEKVIYDTEVMSRLQNSVRESHSLDNLAKELFNEQKDLEILATGAYQADIKPYTLKEIADKKRAEKKGEKYIRPRPSEAILLRLAYQNLDKLSEEVVGHYCNKDVSLTLKLFRYFKSHPQYNDKLARYYSSMAKICNINRARGVRVDHTRLVNAILDQAEITKSQEAKAHEVAGRVFNIHSSQETCDALAANGIKTPKTDAGNPSATTPWLEKRTEPLCEAIVKARQSHKINNDFLLGAKEKLEHTGDGRLYPELNLLRARTGRFSCTGPNIQQIPSDPVYGKICRGIYVPTRDTTRWYSLDYSNQEGRLQIHYAAALKCRGIEDMLKAAQHPDWDMHTIIAEMMGIERKQAKAINLGLSYGMGINKLAESLQVSVPDAEFLKEEYYRAAPYLKDLNFKCKRAMLRKGYIKTLGGRHSRVDPPAYGRTFEYKALNKLIQGSAADQIMAAMVQAHKANLPVLFPVHDELCMIGSPVEAGYLKNIMENVYKLHVPVIVEMNSGDSWGDAK